MKHILILIIASASFICNAQFNERYKLGVKLYESYLDILLNCENLNEFKRKSDYAGFDSTPKKLTSDGKFYISETLLPDDEKIMFSYDVNTGDVVRVTFLHPSEYSIFFKAYLDVYAIKYDKIWYNSRKNLIIAYDNDYPVGRMEVFSTYYDW